MTQAEFHDLSIRLEQLIGEYAAASQRAEAVHRLHGVLRRIPIIADAVAVVSEEPSGRIDATDAVADGT